MLGGRSWDEWIAQYSGSHQHPVNRREERAHRASASGSSTRMGVDSGNTGPPPATSTSAKQATNRRPRAGEGRAEAVAVAVRVDARPARVAEVARRRGRRPDADRRGGLAHRHAEGTRGRVADDLGDDGRHGPSRPTRSTNATVASRTRAVPEMPCPPFGTYSTDFSPPRPSQ